MTIEFPKRKYVHSGNDLSHCKDCLVTYWYNLAVDDCTAALAAEQKEPIKISAGVGQGLADYCGTWYMKNGKMYINGKEIIYLDSSAEPKLKKLDEAEAHEIFYKASKEEISIPISKGIKALLNHLNVIGQPATPSVDDIYLALEKRLKEVNADFGGVIFITDNMYAPPNNWTRIPLNELAFAIHALLAGKDGK